MYYPSFVEVRARVFFELIPSFVEVRARVFFELMSVEGRRWNFASCCVVVVVVVSDYYLACKGSARHAQAGRGVWGEALHKRKKAAERVPPEACRCRVPIIIIIYHTYGKATLPTPTYLPTYILRIKTKNRKLT
jgi:hypothetical protein